MAYIGLVSLDAQLSSVLMVRNASKVPIQADSAPTYAVRGEDGAPIATGTLSSKDSGSVTGATNATPIVITTSAAHNLANGQRVTITGALGNLGANTTATVANKTATTFEMTGVAGTGAYTSSGTWTVTGLYSFAITPTSAAGFDVGRTYFVVFNYVISSVSYSETQSFTIV